MGNIGPLEIGIVLVIALLVFGPKKLPELGRSVGSGMREFKDGVTNRHERLDAEAEAEATEERPKG
jgi:sec-independent protein translocase protein TatA